MVFEVYLSTWLVCSQSGVEINVRREVCELLLGTIYDDTISKASHTSSGY